MQGYFVQHALFMAGNPARFVFHSKSAVAKGDFYLLGVQIRLLTRSKILDVASFLYCLQIIFSLSHPDLTLKRHLDLLSYR